MVEPGIPDTATPVPEGLESDARAAVLAWYDARGRTLAFRATRDPYAILVSEVMAQQTQVARVVEAWRRFLDEFPTVGSLAAATPADVLRAWRGMGYDRRALNLRRAAIAIVHEHGGQVPSDVGALERLPGVGPYTARAVAAIAFGLAVGAVDTNVRRVLGRAIGGGQSTHWTTGTHQAVADATVDAGRPGDWTHALMDVGAVQCRPRNPRCPTCPLERWCRFSAEGAVLGAESRSGPGRSLRPDPTRPPRDRDRAPFTTTTRWLRGRIVDRLRAAEAATWTRIEGPIGSHDDDAIRSAITALARDGVLELDVGDPSRARLPLA